MDNKTNVTSPLLEVMVCYGRPQTAGGPVLVALQVAQGTTLEQAVLQSGILAQCPEIDWSRYRTGIYSKMRPLDTVLQARDRVEIYALLQADPKTARRKRVETTRRSGSKEGVRWLRGRIQSHEV